MKRQQQLMECFGCGDPLDGGHSVSCKAATDEPPAEEPMTSEEQTRNDLDRAYTEGWTDGQAVLKNGNRLEVAEQLFGPLFPVQRDILARVLCSNQERWAFPQSDVTAIHAAVCRLLSFQRNPKGSLRSHGYDPSKQTIHHDLVDTLTFLERLTREPLIKIEPCPSPTPPAPDPTPAPT